ncbi:MAG: excinuclease ABC subunit UvrC, partial [Bacteroidota bacterium]
EKGKFRVCLEYHLGNCKGPCEALQTEEDYLNGLDNVKNILKGNLDPVIQHFKNEMKERAGKMEFEKAEILRKKLEYLQTYSSKSVVINPKLGNLDVFGIAREKETAFVNYLMVKNGAIIQSKTIELKTKLDEPENEVLEFAVNHLRNIFNSNSQEIILPNTIEFVPESANITTPKAGDKKKLLELSQQNAEYFKKEFIERKILHIKQETEEEGHNILQQLQQDIKLLELPLHIECFDNSNFQGSYPVSAMVCFKNAVPSKKDYRHFNVRSVNGINDFATMKEVVYRRYKRLKEEEQSFPQLVIIDGGKGQLSAANEAIDELGLNGKITLIGLAKNEEEIFFTGDKESLKLPFNNKSLQLIRRIRDEVHRFGISFHRQKRSKGTFTNEIESIKGISKQTADTLLKVFGSVKKIKEADENAIAAITGKSKASLIRKYFSAKSKDA